MNQLFFETPQGKIAYRKHSERGEVIIFIHGWLDNSQSFTPLLPFFTDQYQCYTIDLPGHGFSDAPSSIEPYHFTSYISRLYDFIIEHNLQKVHLVGHSFGAAISLCFASAFPEHVNKLALIDGIAPMGEEEELGPSRLRQSILAHKRTRKTRRTLNSIEQAMTLRQSSTELASEHVRLLVEGQIKKTDDGFQWTFDPRLRFPSPTRLSYAQIKAYIQTVEASTLLIKADNGFLINNKQSSELCQKFQNLQIAQLPGHHHLHMESPEQSAEVICKHLAY